MLRNLVVLSQDAEEDKLEDTGLWNMISLEQLTEDIMVKVIQERFTNNMIYTYSGSVLVSVNPYKLLPYYSADIMRSYRKHRPEELPPHLFAMAESAYSSMMTESKNQSIIISGESGSGKTEAAKVIIQYLAFINSKHTRVEQQILEANPLLEAFGNAKTISNDNSSRFGKLVQIYFDKDGRISGARIERYLLEKSRIVYQNPGERNYHIFYQLLSGATLEERASLHLKSPEDYFYLNRNACYEVNEMNDQEEFDIVKKALTIIGISHQSSDIFRVLAAILHLGNISFSVNEQGKAEISDPDAVLACQYAAELLRVPQYYMSTILLKRKMTAGHDRYTIPLTADEAVDNRDALAKAMYDRLFRWLVGVINKSIHPPADQKNKYISILDIFGFESVENNSFEQFCINYANERLQQEFITYVFKLEQEKYQSDGLKWTYIDFKDNKECVDLIEKKPIGMLYLLDDESRLPDGTDQSWVEKVARNHNKGSAFSSVKTDSSSFIINHFAGKVQYNCKNFLEKSRDTFRAQFQDIGKESKDPFIGELLTLVTRDQGKAFGKRPTQATLGLKFKEQVDSLKDVIQGCVCHYLRCIRPNDAKVANEFNQNMVMRQLQYSGMQSTIELRRAGYPVRLPFSVFMSRYKPILPRHATIQSGSERESCLKFMSYLPMYEGEYQLGKTMIFLRYRMNASLEKILHLLRQNASKLIGRAFRNYKAQSERRQNRAASKIQNVFRRKSLLASTNPVRTGQPLSANMVIHEEEETESSVASSQSPVPLSTGIQDSPSEIPTDVETETAFSPSSSVLRLEERAESPPMGISDSQTRKTEPPSPTQEKPPIPLRSGKPALRPNIPRNASSSASLAPPTLLRRSIIPNALPKVVARMFEYLRLKGIEQVGIFRVAGAAAEIQAIMKNIEEGKDVVFHSVSDCNVVATVLKQYIRNMKEPIATYKLYDEFMEAAELLSKEETIEAIKKAVIKLPPFNRMFLQELCLFLSQVAEHSAVNKMVPSNIAIVFAPNIFRSLIDNSDSDYIQSQNTCAVLAAMIESYHAIFEANDSAQRPQSVQMHDEEIINFQFPEYAITNFCVPTVPVLFRQKGPSIMDLLTHTKNPISQALHKNLPVEYRKDAVEIFKNILKFMGDAGKRENPLATCQMIVDKGIKTPSIRDEILSQICRQVSNNRDSKSRLHGWQLMAHCLSCFPPSLPFYPYLKNLILGTAEHPQDTSEKALAKLSLRFMEKIVNRGARLWTICMQEFESMERGTAMIIEVRIPNNRTVKIPSSPVAQVQDICKAIAEAHPVPFSEYYGLYAIQSIQIPNEPDQLDLSPTLYLMDYLMSFEAKQKSVSMRANTFYLLYKQRVFTGEEFENHDYLPILYEQLSEEYKEGRFIVGQQDIPYFTACEIQRRHGDLDSKTEYQLEMSAYLPRYALQNSKGSGYRSKVLDQLTSFNGMDAEACIRTFMEKASSSQFYGCTTFPVKYKVFGSKSVEHEVGISITGIYVLHKDSLSVYMHYPMSVVVEGVMQDENNCEIFYEEENEIKVLGFECNQTGVLIRLLNDYLEILKSKSNKAVALFDYHSDDPLLLSFSRGEVITIMKRNHTNGWFNGSVKGKQGWFPSDYIRVVVSNFKPSSEAEKRKSPLILRSVEVKPAIRRSVQTAKDFIPGIDDCAKAFEPLRDSLFLNTEKHISEILTFTNTPIRQTITKITNEEEISIALESFTAIMKFMGDYVSDEKKYDLIDFICEWAISRPSLRPEIYLQIVKQMTHNQRSESFVHGLMLMNILVGIFIGERDFSVCHRNYLKDMVSCIQAVAKRNGKSSGPSETNDMYYLALNCGSRLRHTIGTGGRMFPPPKIEFEAIMERTKINIRVELLDQTSTSIYIESATTAKDAIEIMSRTIGLKEASGFAIYVRAGAIENAVASTTNMLDLISTYERSPSLVLAGAFSFLMKKRIFLPDETNWSDPTALRLIFYQVAIQFSMGMIVADPNDIIALAVHYSVVCFGSEICSDKAQFRQILSDQLQYMLPSQFLTGKVDVVDKILNSCHLAAYFGFSDIETAAAHDFIKLLQKWAYFGSQIYLVRASGNELPPSCWLAINSQGCHVIEHGKSQPTVTVSYEQLLNWGADDGQLSLAVGNLMQQTRLIFMADQVICSDMSELIRQYHELRTKRRF